jgi:hypothetical protein
MKVVVNIPLKATRVYEDDFDEATIPNVGDDFDDMYVVKNKTIDGNICTLDLKRKNNFNERI